VLVDRLCYGRPVLHRVGGGATLETAAVKRPAALLQWETGLATWGGRSCYILQPRPNPARRPTSLPCIGPLSLHLYSPDGPGADGATVGCGAALLAVAKGATIESRQCYCRRSVLLPWLSGIATDDEHPCYHGCATLVPAAGDVASDDGRRCYRRCCRRRVVMLPALLPTTGGDATGVAADD
jgi:hypothetical protein